MISCSNVPALGDKMDSASHILVVARRRPRSLSGSDSVNSDDSVDTRESETLLAKVAIATQRSTQSLTRLKRSHHKVRTGKLSRQSSYVQSQAQCHSRSEFLLISPNIRMHHLQVSGKPREEVESLFDSNQNLLIPLLILPSS